ncbi:MAG: hypothetical protein ACXVZW_03625 [Gaiellaceae bacterium]
MDACSTHVLRGSLPLWARGGFHPPTQRIPHVLGHSGGIAAVLFAYPLLSPLPKTHDNKILWVSRVPVNSLTSLRIHAQRMLVSRAVGAPVARTVRGGPGPSIVDLPAPGCWRLSLRWAGRTDALDLEYEPSR